MRIELKHIEKITQIGHMAKMGCEGQSVYVDNIDNKKSDQQLKAEALPTFLLNNLRKNDKSN